MQVTLQGITINDGITTTIDKNLFDKYLVNEENKSRNSGNKWDYCTQRLNFSKLNPRTQKVMLSNRQ